MVATHGTLPEQRTDALDLRKRFGYSYTVAKRLSRELFGDLVVLYATQGHTTEAIANSLGKPETQIQAFVDYAKDNGKFHAMPF